MTLSLTLVALWAVVANVIAMTPSKDYHWRNAYILIAVGIPILGYVTAQHGPWIGLLAVAAGCSILRWPMIYFGRWVLRLARGQSGGTAE